MVNILAGIKAEIKKTCENVLEAFQMSAYDVTHSMNLQDTEHKLIETTKRENILFEPKRFRIKQQTVKTGGEFKEHQEYCTFMPIKEQIVAFL